MIISAVVSVNQCKLLERPFGNKRKEGKKKGKRREQESWKRKREIERNEGSKRGKKWLQRERERIGIKRRGGASKESKKREQREGQIDLMPQINMTLRMEKSGKPGYCMLHQPQLLLLPSPASPVLLLCSFSAVTIWS